MAFVIVGILLSLFQKVFVRSGAGIVADSVPESEYEECLNKARATLKALTLAEEVDE